MKFLDWLVVSSADPQKLSATVTGFLFGLIPLAAFFANIPGVNIPDQATLTVTINMIGQVVVYVGGAITALYSAYGLLRKIWRTWNGTNEVLNLNKELE